MPTVMISIVIPCYNAERTLAATIASALEQHVEKEVIVVNDGSTDGSAEIIRQFGNRIIRSRRRTRASVPPATAA